MGYLLKININQKSDLHRKMPELNKLHIWSCLLFGRLLSNTTALFFFKSQFAFLVDPSKSALYKIKTEISFRVSNWLDILQPL